MKISQTGILFLTSLLDKNFIDWSAHALVCKRLKNANNLSFHSKFSLIKVFDIAFATLHALEACAPVLFNNHIIFNFAASISIYAQYQDEPTRIELTPAKSSLKSF